MVKLFSMSLAEQCGESDSQSLALENDVTIPQTEHAANWLESISYRVKSEA